MDKKFMKTFLYFLRDAYGTEDEMHYIVPRLSDEDIIRCVNAYARECCQASLFKAAENADARVEYEYHCVSAEVDKDTITDPSNIVLI